MTNEHIKELRDEGLSWTEIGRIEARTTHADPRTGRSQIEKSVS